MKKNPKDIWTVCLTCHFAFLARSTEAFMCSDCLKESKERNAYERGAWKEEG